MKVIKKLLIAVVVIALGLLAFFYFGKFSTGYRSGKIMKVSERGVVFKTWEGQMDLQTFGAIKDKSNMVTETFKFSIVDDPDLIKDLEAASLAGDRVNLHYYERYMVVPWRGDTKVFAIGIERSENNNTEEQRKRIRDRE